MNEDIKVFSLSGNQDLANEICSHLGIEPGKISVNHFADGETLVEFGESVRGKQVYFVQSTYKPVNERIMELLVAIVLVTALLAPLPWCRCILMTSSRLGYLL